LFYWFLVTPVVLLQISGVTILLSQITLSPLYS
jgi:hypothetical protein